MFFNGKDVLKVREDELQKLRQNIQFVFQDPFASLNPRRSIGASVAEPLVIHHMGDKNRLEKKVRDLLERVGIPAGHASRYPHEFSGGQRQRIAIARALATEPRVIVADEAVSSLDVSIRATVLNLMMELQKEMNLSYIFISHDMAVVERVSHRVAVMYLGQIVEMGSRSDIFENPQHPYTRKAVGGDPRGRPRPPDLLQHADGGDPEPGPKSG